VPHREDSCAWGVPLATQMADETKRFQVATDSGAWGVPLATQMAVLISRLSAASKLTVPPQTQAGC